MHIFTGKSFDFKLDFCNICVFKALQQPETFSRGTTVSKRRWCCGVQADKDRTLPKYGTLPR